ncbi:MAG: metallophosphoesterase [Capsulimonadaceae bacterium]
MNLNETEPVDPRLAGADLSRRQLLGLAVRTATIGGVVGVYGAGIEANRLMVEHTVVHLPRWPREADGLRIGLLSDFHCDYDQAVIRTRRAVAMLAALHPDVVFVAGDFISDGTDRRYLRPTVRALAPLASIGRGAYAILGNHDWWGGMQEILDGLLARAGFAVLRNQSLMMPGVDGAYIVGVDDALVGAIDVERALRGVPPHAAKLLVMHEPDFADEVGEGFDLQISGHSHGGQIRLPWLPVLHAPAYGTKYPEGLKRAQNHLVYTTRGVGMIGPQIRTFCPPEVTLLTLRTGTNR